MELSSLLQKLMLNSVEKGMSVKDNVTNVSCDISDMDDNFISYRIGNVTYRLSLEKKELGLSKVEEGSSD